jgi:hypothetical protein
MKSLIYGEREGVCVCVLRAWAAILLNISASVNQGGLGGWVDESYVRTCSGELDM